MMGPRGRSRSNDGFNLVFGGRESWHGAHDAARRCIIQATFAWRHSMNPEHDPLPGVTDDPVLRFILEGRAANLHDAEELYLDESLDEIFALIASPLSNDELERHPLMRLLAAHGMRGWEDSLL